MNIKFEKTFCLILMLFLSACAVPKEKPPELTPQRIKDSLPGAVVSDDGLQISYPGNALFAEGSVLPLPGGMQVLEPLVTLLNSNRQYNVVATVRSRGHDEEYDQLLASKRRDILEAIFRNRGISEERLQIRL